MTHFVVIASLLLASITGTNAYCFLCANGMGPLAERQSLRLQRNSDLTCSKLDLDIIMESSTSDICTESIDLYRRSCCDRTYDPEIFPTDPPSAYVPPPNPYASQPGPYGYCPICFQGYDMEKEEYLPGGVPTNKAITWAVYLLGANDDAFTCLDLYYRGEVGQIPDTVCRNLFDETTPSCGCPAYSGNQAPGQTATTAATTVATTTTKPTTTTTTTTTTLPAVYDNSVIEDWRASTGNDAKNSLAVWNQFSAMLGSEFFYRRERRTLRGA